MPACAARLGRAGPVCRPRKAACHEVLRDRQDIGSRAAVLGSSRRRSRARTRVPRAAAGGAASWRVAGRRRPSGRHQGGAAFGRRGRGFWASARSAVSWCRRNGRGDRHRIGVPRASIFFALSAGAAESSARRNELPSYSARPRRAHALGVRCRGGLRFCELQSARRPKSSRLMCCSRSTQLCAPSPAQYRRSDLCVAALSFKVCSEAAPRFSRPLLAPRGDDWVSCLAPTPAPRGAEGLSEPRHC